MNPTLLSMWVLLKAPQAGASSLQRPTCGREGVAPAIQAPSYAGARDARPDPARMCALLAQRGWGATRPVPIDPCCSHKCGQADPCASPSCFGAALARSGLVPLISPKPSFLVTSLSLQGPGRGRAARGVPGCRAEVRASPPGLWVIHIKQWAPLFLPAERARAGLLLLGGREV